METDGSITFWSVLLVAAVLLLVTLAVRRVGPGELVVVMRGDRVARSRSRGTVVRVPGLEHFATVESGPRVLPLVVRGTTRDGTDLVVLADLRILVEHVAAGTPYDDPALRAVRCAEQVLGEALAGLDVAELGGLVEDADRASGLVARLVEVVRDHLAPETKVTGLSLTEVQARLTVPVVAALNERGEAR